MTTSGDVVVGVSASPEAHHVLDAARTFAKRLGARIHLVHAIGLPPGAPLDQLTYPSLAITEALHTDAETFMKRIKGEIDPRELGGARVVNDLPWRAICDTAERIRASLVIVGAHDPRFSDALLGTTAAKVANRAKCSVLVVRRHTQALMHTLAFHQLLVALDGSLRAPLVLDTAMRIAHDEHARATLLRVVTPPAALGARFLGTAPAELEHALRMQATAELEALRAGVGGSAPTKLEVRIGAPWQCVTSAAVELGADLIVVGSHGYEVLDRVLGTTAAKVVNHTDRSVLIAR
jgi:universal stress protein F